MPRASTIYAREKFESERSGNSPYDPEGDWVDYAAAGVEDYAAIAAAAARVLSLVRLDRDVYQMGLRGTIDPQDQPELAGAILEARRAMGERLRDPRLGRLVEVFDPERYNTNATLAENLLFGAPIGATFEMERLAAHPYVQRIIEQAGLTTTLAGVGLQLASTMVELFADLPPDHEYFRQFSFIGADDLPEYRTLIGRIDANRLDALSAGDRERLISLTFKLIPARHHLGLVEEPLQARILEARRLFREHLPDDLAGAVAFFDPDHYTAGATVQDNVLFGKIAYGQAQATERISELIEDVLQDLGLRERIIEAGLRAPTGVSGARLSLAQRQKLALARAMLKRPEVLIAYDPIGPLDPAEQTAVLDAVLEAFEGRTVIWALSRGDWASGSTTSWSCSVAGSSSRATMPPSTRTAARCTGWLPPSESRRSGQDEPQAKTSRSCAAFRSSPRSSRPSSSCWPSPASGCSSWMATRSATRESSATPPTSSSTARPTCWSTRPPARLRVATVGKNDIIGEIAILCDVPRTATVTASTDLTTLKVSKDNFFQLLTQFPQIGIEVMHELASRLHHTTQELTAAKARLSELERMCGGR